MRSGERLRSISRGIWNSWQLYVLLIAPLLYLVIFKYGPMYGAQIAFKDYRITQGIWESPWAGLKHFRRFVNSFDFWMLIRNTLALSFYELLAGFPVPIILALSLNYVGKSGFKKTVQMVTYAPHFISTVVMVGIILQFLAPRFGFVNLVIQAFGGESINFMGRVRWWRSIFVWSGVWQRAGYGSIIYLAALSSIDPQLHEAAIVDGATKPQRIWHIDLPGIMPTAVILLILNIGRILNIGFEKVLLMQNPLNLPVSEIIDTYVYKIGLASPTVNFAYPTAIGLFRSAISLILLIAVNRVAKHVTESSLW